MNSFFENIKCFFSRSCNENDLKNLFIWFNSEKGHSEIKEVLDKSWNTFRSENNIDIDSKKILLNIKKGLQRNHPPQPLFSVRNLLPYAAMIALIVSFTFFIFKYREIGLRKVHTNQRYTSVVTENGQRSKIVLADSSIVWLNSGTKFSYNENFSIDERKVILDGQAFFEIAHNEKIPFKVQCKDLIITVVGTKFDVNAYPTNDKINIMLESGKVNLSHQKLKSVNYSMAPGELAKFNLSNSKISVSNPDVKKYSSWKDGVLIFRNDQMKDVIEKLGRWYNIDIIVKDPEVYDSFYSGTIQNESYEQIFRLIEYTCPIKCQLIYSFEPDVVPKVIMTIKN